MLVAQDLAACVGTSIELKSWERRHRRNGSCGVAHDMKLAMISLSKVTQV